MNRYLFLVCLVVLFVGCDKEIKDFQARSETNKRVYEECVPVDYHHGVLYFPCNREEFGKKSSHYLETHPEQEILGVTVDQGIDIARGYFVFVKKKEK